MSRFFAPKENIKGDLIYIDGKEARHILNVMRLKENDKVVVFDGTGREYAGFIKEEKQKSLIVEIVSTKTPSGRTLPEITLAQSVPKREKMDYIVEKSTELGIHAIIPVISERTIARPNDERADARVARWQTIAREASKQCGRTDIPKVEAMQKFYNTVDIINNFDLALFASLSEEDPGTKPEPIKILLPVFTALRGSGKTFS